MPSQSGNLLHCWVLPDNYLVQREAMGTHKLIFSLRKDQVTNLTSCVDTVKLGKVDGVPEANALVSSTTTCSKKASMKWAPVYCFYGCLMI